MVCTPAVKALFVAINKSYDAAFVAAAQVRVGVVLTLLALLAGALKLTFPAFPKTVSDMAEL